MEWLQRNKYFHVVVKGVERDGWKFVLLARFSPLPSYIINYALSATDVGFFRDFLLPTVIGCLPMILQNVSIVSLAGAAVASTTGSNKSHIYSYLFPAMGIVSSVLISWRIKQYSSALAVPEELQSSPTNGNDNGDAKLGSTPSKNTSSGKTRKRRWLTVSPCIYYIVIPSTKQLQPMLVKSLDFHIGLPYSKLSCLFHAMVFGGHLTDAQSVIELLFLWQIIS